MPKDNPQEPVNPPHNPIDHEKPEKERLRLYFYHKRADTLELYYEQYPMDRPQSREPRPGSRGR